MIACFALLLLAAPVSARAQDAGEWIRRLESPAWAERELAQRRLAGLLTGADRALVRSAFASGGAETRLRLAEVLAGEDRLFGLAAELATDPEPELARAGLASLRLAIERLDPAAREPWLEGDDLRAALLDEEGVPLRASIELVSRVSLQELVALAAAAQSGAPPVAIDPGFADRAARPFGENEGHWPAFVRRAAQTVRGRLVGSGLRREAEPAAVRWLAIVPRERGAEADSVPLELVARWCLDFARAGDDERRAASARALGALRWIPVLDWFGRRWEHGDAAAFEGLLLAARAGAPACFQGAGARERLWNALESGADEPRGLHVALALAAAGPPPPRSAEAERAARAPDTALPRAACLRLVVLEGWGAAFAPAAGIARALLADAGLHTGIAYQALRVAAASGDPPASFHLAGAQSLFALAVLGDLPEFGALARGMEGWPPEDWADPAVPLRFAPAGLVVPVLDGWLAHGRVDEAGRYAAALLADVPDLPERLGALRGVHADACIAEAWERAVAHGIAAADLPFLRVRAGVATPAGLEAVRRALAERTPASPGEWLALGAACAGPDGAVARARLLALAGALGQEEVLPAAIRAVEALRAAGLDADEREFLRGFRAALSIGPGGQLSAIRLAADLPPRSVLPVRDLSAISRDPSLLGL